MLTDVAKIKKTLDQYIVRPANFFGLGGFVFDVEGDAVVTLNNEITDHYAEDNTVVQDNIAVMPKRVVLQSYVGELADIVEDRDNGFTQKVVRKLTILNGLFPDLAAGAQQVKDAIQTQNGQDGIDIGAIGDVSLEGALDIYSIVKNFTPPTSKQESAYQYFKALRDQKILMSIQTPFEFMTNMAIETVVARQGAGTRFVSDFTVTFKEIRFAETITTEVSAEGRRAQQTKLPTDQAEVNGVNKSLGNEALDAITGSDTAKEITDAIDSSAAEAADNLESLSGWLSQPESDAGGIVFRNPDGSVNNGEDVNP